MLTLCQARSGAGIREWDTALALKELSHRERCGLPPWSSGMGLMRASFRMGRPAWKLSTWEPAQRSSTPPWQLPGHPWLMPSSLAP